MQDGKNYQPVMIMTLNQNGGKATKDEIKLALQKANPEHDLNYFTNCPAFEVLTESHPIANYDPQTKTFHLLDYDTYNDAEKAWITNYCNEKMQKNSEKQYTVLDNEVELANAQKVFLENLRKFTTKKDRIVIGFPGPGENVDDDVEYISQYDMWWYSRNLPNEAIPRFWNCFGIGEPNWGKNTSIVSEINPPMKEINRQCNGAFVKDQQGNVYLCHNGLVGGGKKYGRFDDAYPHDDKWIQANDGKQSPRDLILISDITSSELPKNIAEYVKLVSKFKAGKNISNKTPFYLLFRHKSEDNPYEDDPSGKVYHFPKIANYTKVIPNAKAIWYDRINGTHYFWGYGTISEVTPRANGDFDAVFNDFTFFEQEPDSLEKEGKFLKKATPEIENLLLNRPGWNPQHSISEIDKSLYDRIIGNVKKTNGYENIPMKSNYSRIVDTLKRKKNIILYGPPGTGKTYTAKEIAKIITNSSSSESRHTWNTVTTMVLIENEGQPLNYHEITNRVLEKNLVQTKGQTPEETIAKNMRNDIEKYGDDSFFIKISDGVYGLNVPATFAKAAKMILFAYNKPMRSAEIAEIAHHKKLINSAGETPERTMSTEIIRDIQNNGDNSSFVKVGEGVYALRKHHIPLTNSEQSIENVTFHQSYGYEEFIEGIRPTPANNGITYSVEPGIFQEFCKKAQESPEQDYVIIIDEINRGNISKIFGELITIIEKDKRGTPVTLAYSKKSFNVPENVYVIGTMNTADQSLTHMDAALKRRFSLVEIMPNPSLLNTTSSGIPLKQLLETINDRILSNGSRDNQIGHSYFMDNANSLDSTDDIQFVFATDIIPLLRDYFYDDEESLKEILGGKFIDWDNPHRNMEEDWQNDPNVFLQTLKDAFGIQIG